MSNLPPFFIMPKRQCKHNRNPIVLEMKIPSPVMSHLIPKELSSIIINLIKLKGVYIMYY